MASSDRCDLLCLDLPRAEALRQERLSPENAAALAGRLKALSDPTRLTIVLALRDGGELCVCDLSWIVERAQNLVSHHLRALRVEELVAYRREGKMALYSLTAQGRELLRAFSVIRMVA